MIATRKFKFSVVKNDEARRGHERFANLSVWRCGASGGAEVLVGSEADFGGFQT